MPGRLIFAQHGREVSLVLAIMLLAFVNSVPASANDNLVKVAGAVGEQRAVVVPVSHEPSSHARQLGRNRRSVANARPRYCTYVGCRGYHLLGIGF